MFMDYERQNLDNMEKAAGKFAMCPEADGLVTVDATTDVIMAIQNCCDIPIDIKPYPQNMPQWIDMAMEKYPLRDFSVKSKHNWDRLRKISQRLVGVARDMWLDVDKPNISMHADFGEVLAAYIFCYIEGEVFIGSSDGKTYSSTNGKWDTYSSNSNISLHIARGIEEVFGTRYINYSHGKILFKTTGVHDSFKTHKW